MSHEGFTAQHRIIGRAAAWMVFLITPDRHTFRAHAADAGSDQTQP